MITVKTTISMIGFFVGLISADLGWTATYWVSPSGSDSNSCSSISGSSDPGRYRKTITGGAQCVSGGDTLFIKNGIYAEKLSNHLPSGTASRPTTMEGESTGGVIIRPGSGSGAIIGFSQARSYLTFRRMTLDGINTTRMQLFRTSNGHTNYFVLEDMVLKNSTGDGTSSGGSSGLVCGDGSAGPWTVRRLKIHDINLSGIYWQCSNGILEHLEVYNTGSNGIIIQSNSHDTRDNIVRYNYIHHVGLNQRDTHRGLTLQENNTVMHNNLILPGGQHTCVKITSGNSGKFYNNTCYGGRVGIHQSGGTNMEVRNNIIWANSGSAYQHNGGSGTTFSGNVCASGSICEITSNPLFLDTQNNDFRLQVTSPAIGKGATVTVIPLDAIGSPPTSPGKLQASSQ
jgi:hypothetical protein